MRKVIVLMLMVLMLVGCGKKEETVETTVAVETVEHPDYVSDDSWNKLQNEIYSLQYLHDNAEEILKTHYNEELNREVNEVQKILDEFNTFVKEETYESRVVNFRPKVQEACEYLSDLMIDESLYEATEAVNVVSTEEVSEESIEEGLEETDSSEEAESSEETSEEVVESSQEE